MAVILRRVVATTSEYTVALSFPYNRIDALRSLTLSLCNSCCTVDRGPVGGPGVYINMANKKCAGRRGGWPVATLARAIVQNTLQCGESPSLRNDGMHVHRVSPPVATIGRKSRARQEYQLGPTWAILVRNAEQGLLRGEGASCVREDPY
jgi:hypothetical protein